MKSSARTPRLPLLTLSLLAALVVSSCVDAPSAPDASTFAPPFVFAPSLALVGPGGAPAATQAQEDALNEAFDLVDHFRMVVTRLSTGEVVVDTVITVTPGQDSYDLSVTINVMSADEQFSVQLTALQGTRELFTAAPVTVTATTATQAASSTPPAPTNVTMQYSGPGVTATTVLISPATLVLGPDGSGSFSAEVQGSDGSVISDVPLSWTVSLDGVVSVAAGTATATGEGAVQVVVATPTGLEARAWAYVVGGELAYAEGGVVKVRSTAGGEATDRSSAGGAGQPAWSPDGSRLFYAAAGRVHLAGGDGLVNGSWPSVSPDGSKLAVDAGGSIMFANDDGTNPTQGPSGGTPVWTDAANLLVSGGSVEQVRADGSGRTTVAGGSASLPARGPGGQVAYVADGQLFATGRADAILDGAVGRPSWSANGMWLVVQTGRGLTLVPADGSAPGASLPGLAAAFDPAFQPGGALEPHSSVAITGLDPDPPTPGEPVTILGSGFDWIIPANNRVFWPTLDGVVEGEIRSVTETRIEAVMPRSVAEGQIRVETRASTGLLTFDPQLAAIDVIATTPFGDPVAGIEVVVRDTGGTEILRGQTDDEGRVLMAGLTPGTYQVELVMPTGFRLEGEALHTLTLRTETVLLEVEVMPLVQAVTTVPEVLEVEVGSRLEVTLVPVDFRGQVIGRLSSSRWLGGTPHLAATGEGLEGIIIGATPSTGPLEAVLAVALNGDVFELPVSVTSYVDGTVVQDPDPVTTESSSDAQPSTVDATTEPAVGTEVKVILGGVVVSTGIADGRGHYHAGGLFAGTYDVTIDPTADRSPVPDLQTVVLDNGRPTATADFLMSRASVDHLALDAGTAEIDAIDGTTTIEVIAYDIDENVLGGRRATFVSLDPAVGTVDARGVVTGITNGTAAIEVTVEGVTATINITVDQKAVVITLLDDNDMTPMPDEIKAFVGSGGTMLWEAFDANGHPVTHKTPNFTTSDALVASVDAAGLVVPLAVGQSDLTVEMDGATDVLKLTVLGTHTGDLIIADVSGTGVKTPAEVAAEMIGLVEGNLVIESTGLTNLIGLESLLEIDGSVLVRLNSSLMDMAAIGGIRYVELDMRIEGNPLLGAPPLMAAFMLQVVDGSLQVVDNDAMTDMDFLANLRYVGGTLDFTGNATLTNLDGLSQIRYLPGTLYLQGNPLLDSQNNLPALEGIGTDLIIEAGAKVFGLPSLNGVAGLLQAGGTVEAWNLILEELHFPVLMCTGGGIKIYANEVLTVVNFPALDAVDSDCGTPTILPVVTPSTTLGPDFVFEPDSRQNTRRSTQPDNDEATRQLREKYEATEQRHQEARASLDARRTERRTAQEARTRRDAAESEARNAEFVRHSVDQRNRLDLERVARSSDGIPVASPAAEARAARNLQPAREASTKSTRVDSPQREYAMGPDLRIWSNPALSAVDLTALQWVEGTLEFWGIGLTSLSLPALQDVGGALRVGSNANLTSFSAPMLEDVASMVELFDNPILSSFLAPALLGIGGSLEVTWNGVQGVFSLPQLQFVGWSVEVNNNTGVTSVSLPILAEAMGGVDVTSNDGLVAIDMATGSELSLSDDGADLDIRDNDDLETVLIPGLTYVYDGIYVINNSSLVSVVIATTALLTMDWSLWIADNNVPHPWAVTIPGLVHLRYGLKVQNNTGLQSVTMASGDPAQIDEMFFFNNAGLESISLPSLTSVFDGDFYVQQEVDLQQVSAPMLRDIKGDLYLDNLGTMGTPIVLAFDALEVIGNYMYLQNSPGLENFTLPSLVSSRYGGMVWQNPNLTTFGLPSLAYMTLPPPPPMVSSPEAVIPPISSASDLWIESNPALTGFDLSSLMDVDGLYVKDNAVLAAFPGTGPLSAGTRVFVADNPSMTSLAGLAGVTDLHTLQLQNNPLLTNYAGLSALQNIVYFQMWSGGGAGNVSLPGLQRVWYDIEFLNNGNLTGVSAPALTHVGDGLGPQSGPGNVSLNFNPLLATVDYSALATVDAQIQIFNSSLTDLNGFAGLTSPIYALAVQNNSTLTSVLGLAGIGNTSATPAVVSNFVISGNAVLDDCQVMGGVVNVIEARNPGGAFGVAPVISNVPCGQQD